MKGRNQPVTMKKADVLRGIQESGLLPVLRAGSFEEALALATALREGGIRAIEVTMTVPDALRVMRELVRSEPGLLIGAGTVLDAETARICLLEGAQFIVSPSTDVRTIELCNRYSAAVFPGALTPTEVVAAWQAGADAVKIFPASALGGAKYLRSLKAPLPHIELVPTGGVALETVGEFLAAGAFALGVGTDLVNPEAIRWGTPETISQMARAYLRAIVDHRRTTADQSTPEK
jgi:2-dehydro-3-deoxyphosphogluconate aldolase/(4S)-4-hydroxy-2-oxoglutarate aldolase